MDTGQLGRSLNPGRAAQMDVQVLSGALAAKDVHSVFCPPRCLHDQGHSTS